MRRSKSLLRRCPTASDASASAILSRSPVSSARKKTSTGSAKGAKISPMRPLKRASNMAACESYGETEGRPKRQDEGVVGVLCAKRRYEVMS
eukprot:scaffold620_cov282-Pinguiococcus_pyrenoidosus.AAC.9